MKFYIEEEMVPGTGLEPACREALAPETSVSTNSTTRAHIRAFYRADHNTTSLAKTSKISAVDEREQARFPAVD